MRFNIILLVNYCLRKSVVCATTCFNCYSNNQQLFKLLVHNISYAMRLPYQRCVLLAVLMVSPKILWSMNKTVFTDGNKTKISSCLCQFYLWCQIMSLWYFLNATQNLQIKKIICIKLLKPNLLLLTLDTTTL